MWTDFIYATGDVLTQSFKILPILGNNFNAILIVVGFIMLFWWIGQMVKYNKQAKENGTLP